MTTNGLGNATVGNEIKFLLKYGITVRLHSLSPSDAPFFESEQIQEIHKDAGVLYPVSKGKLLFSALAAPFLFRGRLFSAAWNAVFGRRESFKIRLKGMWHLLMAAYWATSLRHEKISLIHSQWIHSAGTVAMYGAWLLGVPFSFTGHAADLFRDRAALLDKIERAEFIVCISEFHREFFLQNGARPDQLHIVYCGIDGKHFVPVPAGRQPVTVPRILSSGRLVEKKGFNYLIDACALLKARGVAFECVIGGSGPLETELRDQIAASGLGDEVHLTGEAIKQEHIPEFMHSGHLYCLPCVWAADNDVDGLPQMLMEAMACGLPSVSTRLVGIPDLVIDRETGLLVEPESPEQLADALQLLLEDPELSQQLAQEGRRIVLEKFDINRSLEPLVALFRKYLAKTA